MASPFGPLQDKVDLGTEFVLAATFVIGTAGMIWLGRRQGLAGRPGWRWIPVGLGLLATMATLDFLDEFLDSLWLVGGMDAEPYLEDLLLPLGGAGALVAGLLRWAPLHGRLEAAQAEVKQAEIKRLREMDEFKTTFLNTAAHELATPLTPIRLQLGLMARDRGAERGVQMLERNFTRLERLVTDLMDAARLQSGHLAFAPRPLDVNTLLGELQDTFEARCLEAGLRFHVELEPGLRMAAADDLRLNQVFMNLLGNAVKFTTRGGDIKLHAQHDGDAVVVSVSDTGAGLDRAEIEAIFQPFEQRHRELVGPHVGTGLGLYISRGIVEAHGGTIEAMSAGRGRGACFRVRLPVRPPALPVHPEPARVPL